MKKLYLREYRNMSDSINQQFKWTPNSEFSSDR